MPNNNPTGIGGQEKGKRSRNPIGRPRQYWIAAKKRVKEANKSFDKLCAIRDDPETPSQVVVKASEKILAYTVGLPDQHIELANDPDNPVTQPAPFDFEGYKKLFLEEQKEQLNGSAAIGYSNGHALIEHVNGVSKTNGIR